MRHGEQVLPCLLLKVLLVLGTRLPLLLLLLLLPAVDCTCRPQP
jgi:hypothetical protein